MIASIVMIICSAALIVYWLRYTCLLLIEAHQPEEETECALFHFPSVRKKLAAGADCAGLRHALDRDYAALSYLTSKAPFASLESRLLVWDYRLMRLWHALSQTALPAQSRNALAEMADVVAVLAGRLRQSEHIAEGA